MEWPPDEYLDEHERPVMRWLQGTKWDNKWTYCLMCKHINWAMENTPVGVPAGRNFLNTGVAYIAGRAKPGY